MIRKYSRRLSATEFETESLHPSSTHYATRWMVDLETGDWSAPIVDTDWDTIHKLYYDTGKIFDEGVKYKARVAFMDQIYVTSDWSDEVLFAFIRGPVKHIVTDQESPALTELRLGPLLQQTDLSRAATEIEDKVNEIVKAIRRLQEQGTTG